ncbi:hypothetical protein RHS01_11354 [Rhizoctonia solani]|uniref:Uncharacterized protein n=1 Tax=Rhizoctonia solani TaxID=456999 RepID=A0A8H7LWF5_9AGAM|nr:hypothetical protein RHS01_11354 [Rhizoctonia solani]
MKWQPAPGAPLVPRPLSIKESWDPLFRQLPMSQPALNPRSMGKSPSAMQSPSSWDCKTKSSGWNGNLRNKKKPQRKLETGWEQSTKPSLASRLGVEPHTHQKTGSLRQLKPRPGPYQKPTLSQRLARPSLPGQPHKSSPRLCTANSRPGSPASPYSPSAFAYPTLFPPSPTNSGPCSYLSSPGQGGSPQRLYGKNWEQVATVAHKNVGMGPPQPTNVPNGSRGTLLPLDEHEGRSRSMGTPPS